MRVGGADVRLKLTESDGRLLAVAEMLLAVLDVDRSDEEVVNSAEKDAMVQLLVGDALRLDTLPVAERVLDFSKLALTVPVRS